MRGDVYYTNKLIIWTLDDVFAIDLIPGVSFHDLDCVTLNMCVSLLFGLNQWKTINQNISSDITNFNATTVNLTIVSKNGNSMKSERLIKTLIPLIIMPPVLLQIENAGGLCTIIRA